LVCEKTMEGRGRGTFNMGEKGSLLRGVDHSQRSEDNNLEPKEKAVPRGMHRSADLGQELKDIRRSDELT